jgi:hypothetical protein
MVSARTFIEKLRYATSENHYQITTDGFALYPDAIHAALYDRVSYAKLVKVYASPRDACDGSWTRGSSLECG